MAGGAGFLLLRCYYSRRSRVVERALRLGLAGNGRSCDLGERKRATELASLVVVAGGHEEEAGDHTAVVGCDGSDLARD